MSDPFIDILNSITPNHEFCIYGDDKASIWSVVDEEDYQYLIQWRWSPKWSKRGKKVYLRRNFHEGIGRENRIQKTLFLHTAVMLRTGIDPPSPFHVLVDHLDGDGMNCRRNNLRWATHSMNCKNLYGKDLNNGSTFI